MKMKEEIEIIKKKLEETDDLFEFEVDIGLIPGKIPFNPIREDVQRWVRLEPMPEYEMVRRINIINSYLK